MARSELDIILKVTDKASKKLDTVGGKIAGIGGKALKAAGIAGAAIGAIGVAALVLAKDSSAIPGITAAFEGLTKGIEGGSKKMLAAMQKGSIGMISNTELMRQFNLANQLVGEDFAKKLPDAMGLLGKVSAATGEDLGYLMDSLTRGVGRLSPMILDNLGIQVDMNQAYEDYALSIGKSTDELTKSEQQAAVMEQVMTKLQANTANMPEVAGSAAQQFATFTATLANAKDTIGVALIPALIALVETLTPIIEEYGPKIALWLGENLPIAIEKAAVFFKTKLIPFVDKVKAGFLGFKFAIQAIPIIIDAMREKAVAFFEKIKAAMPDWLIPGSPTPLEVGIKGIKTSLDEIGPDIAGLGQDQRQFFGNSTVNINNGTSMDAFEGMLRGLT